MSFDTQKVEIISEEEIIEVSLIYAILQEYDTYNVEVVRY